MTTKLLWFVMKRKLTISEHQTVFLFLLNDHKNVYISVISPLNNLIVMFVQANCVVLIACKLHTLDHMEDGAAKLVTGATR